MEQESELTLEQAEELYKAILQHWRNARIDWVNRTIDILSDPEPVFGKDGKQLMLSYGPATHRRYLHRVRFDK